MPRMELSPLDHFRIRLSPAVTEGFMRRLHPSAESLLYVRSRSLVLLLVTLFPMPSVASAQTAAVSDEEGNPLGEVALRPVPCIPPASELLRTGLALLHNMTYEEARTHFTEALALDPDCVLGYWGVAMSYIHPLWPDRPTAEDLVAGSRILATVESRRAPTAYETALLDPVRRYFRDAGERTEVERLASFHAGWEQAARQFPGDAEIQLFHALSLIVAAQGSSDMMAMHARAGEMAQEVLRAVPRHPGALHYIIHASDLPELAERGEPAARSYGEIIPENAHALHMTSHIFTRLGEWEQSIEYNRRATEAALRPPLDGLSLPNFFHAADYLVYALLQRGEYASARAIGVQLREMGPDLPQPPHPAAAFTIAAVPVRLALERQAWAEASRLETRPSSSIPWDQLPHLEAITTFARGLGAARTGDMELAAAALAQLTQLRERAADLADPFDWQTQVRIQELTLDAWIQFADSDKSEALRRMEQAAELEQVNEKNAVSPGNVLPAMELYGDMQMEAGRYAEALIAYEKALERAPNRLNSFYGAGRAAQALGDNDTAQAYFLRVTQQASESADHDRVRQAAAFLRGG